MPAEITFKTDLAATLAASLKARAAQVVEETAEALAERMKAKILEPPKTGRIYRRQGEEHQASAPGESPANWTAELAESVKAEMIGPTEAQVSVGAEHGIYLEMGTRHIAPRPFVTPARDEIEPEFLEKAAALLEETP